MAKIDALFKMMKEKGGSDLHLSPGNPPLLRQAGDLKPMTPEKVSHEQCKGLAYEIMTDAQRKIFEETLDIDFAYEVMELKSRFRANIFNGRHGVSAVFRLIPAQILTAEQLGLPETVLKFTQYRRGLVLVTGPTGSGKSTTLAAMIDHINKTRHEHILTVEDPVEFVHESQKSLVSQREVGRHTRSFAAALRAALREDPDIILVGEMRDLETIELAITAAETGHLVFGTLHTNSAPKTVDRIINVFPTNQQEQIRAMLGGSSQGGNRPAVAEDGRWKTVRRPGNSRRQLGGCQPDPGGENLPDSLRHPNWQRGWNADDGSVFTGTGEGETGDCGRSA